MSRRSSRALSLAIAGIAVAAAVYIGWHASPVNQRQVTSRRAALLPMALPDLARVEAEVRQQIRDDYALLAKVMADPGTSTSELAEAFGSFGKLLFTAEYLADAELALQNAQALASTDMRWPYYLAQLYRSRQEPDRAIPMFERVLVLAPNDLPALTWLGELHLLNGDALAAEAYLEKALTLQPDSAAVASRLGRVALAKKDHRQAIIYLERALQLQPEATSIHYPLGIAYRDAGQAAQAEAHLRLASDSGGIAPADPLIDELSKLLQNAGALEARGMAALAARDWAGAVSDLRRAADLAPLNAVTRLNLGTALSLTGDSAGARRELLQAVRLAPQLAKAHFGLGLLAQDEGRWDEAAERFATAGRYDPAFVDAHFALAEILRRTGRAEQSLLHYADVLQLNGAGSQARFGAAMALVSLHRYVEAGEALGKAVQLHPDHPGFPHALARILAAAPDPQARNGTRAHMLMRPLAARHPSAAVSETMAMVLAELGEFDEAADWQERAITQARAMGQGELAARMRDNLALYRRGEPCRTPWRVDDPVLAVSLSP